MRAAKLGVFLCLSEQYNFPPALNISMFNRTQNGVLKYKVSQ